ncbi:MAG TPA: GxxExxY protein [Patescibacteria group bacterium]|nr:GxxExxY protein [Patescibacteria group bacterium]
METNATNKKLIYPELSYLLVGVCFEVHNDLGHYGREKQYGDLLEKKLTALRIPFRRELRTMQGSNILDFLIENKIVLELKTKYALTKEDYYQLQRYLQQTGFRLGLLINFRSKYLRPKRVIRIDKNPDSAFM